MGTVNRIVWTVLYVWWDTTELLGVFSSEQKALEFARTQTRYRISNLDIFKCTLNGAVQAEHEWTK